MPTLDPEEAIGLYLGARKFVAQDYRRREFPNSEEFPAWVVDRYWGRKKLIAMRFAWKNFLDAERHWTRLIEDQDDADLLSRLRPLEDTYDAMEKRQTRMQLLLKILDLNFENRRLKDLLEQLMNIVELKGFPEPASHSVAGKLGSEGAAGESPSARPDVIAALRRARGE